MRGTVLKLTRCGVLGYRAFAVVGAAFDQAWEEIKLDFDLQLSREAARLMLANEILAIVTDDSRDVAELKRAAILGLTRRLHRSAPWIARHQMRRAIADTRAAIATSRTELEDLRASIRGTRAAVEQSLALLSTEQETLN